MEEDLNVFFLKEDAKLSGWVYLALASPLLGTAQPRLVLTFLDHQNLVCKSLENVDILLNASYLEK